jgi:hypothetical protein
MALKNFFFSICLNFSQDLLFDPRARAQGILIILHIQQVTSWRTTGVARVLLCTRLYQLSLAAYGPALRYVACCASVTASKSVSQSVSQSSRPGLYTARWPGWVKFSFSLPGSLIYNMMQAPVQCLATFPRYWTWTGDTAKIKLADKLEMLMWYGNYLLCCSRVYKLCPLLIEANFHCAKIWSIV